MRWLAVFNVYYYLCNVNLHYCRGLYGCNITHNAPPQTIAYSAFRNT